MIILSGASGGIGQEIINPLSKIDKVIGLYNTSRPKNDDNGNLIYEKVDLRNKNEIDSFVQKWKQDLVNITLIHCAGSKIDALSKNYSIEDWNTVIDINLKGDFMLTQALLPIMIKNNWGRLIHMSSKGALEGDVGTIAYSASKSGLIGMSRVLGKEYARFNVTSNVVLLGAFETGLYLKLSSDQKSNILKKIPSKKLGNPSNIINAIEFLIKSEYVNASKINIDGGV